MRTISIPLDLMTATNCDWDIEWRGRSSGDTNSGSRQIVYNAMPRWIGSPQMALEGKQIAEWRAIRARAQGRQNVYRVPMIDPLSFDYSLISKQQASRGTPHIDNSLFSTGNGYEYVPAWSVVPEPFGVFDTGTPGILPNLGAYQMWLDTGDTGATPQIGGIYSAHDLPFLVTEATPLSGLTDVTAYLAGSGLPSDEAYRQTQAFYRITFEMPLRKALTADDVVSVIAFGLFFAEGDQTGRISYGGEQYAQPSFKFVEWLR